MSDTITSISTPFGTGGIAMIRVSGPDAIRIADSIYEGKRPLTEEKAGTVHYGRITRDGEVLDEVMVTVLRAPQSFTGEDTIEIACHGSMYIQQELVRWLIDAGCRTAEAGEFTKRAFLSGRIDLTQAEAVADLIAARSRAEKDLALCHLRGGLSSELDALRDQLLHFASLIELELDFADHEELEFADRTELKTLAREIGIRLQRLTESFKTGNAIRQGIPVAIIGATNAGKSTLLNALLGEERAIVSDISGTTRDTVEDTLLLNGILFLLIDTAGIRDTSDAIEQLGIQRSIRAMKQAAIIIHMIDATNPDEKHIPLHEHQTLINVYNKCDKVECAGKKDGYLYISAKHGSIEPIRQALIETARKHLEDQNAATVSNARHYEALVRAEAAILRVENGLQMGISGELLDIDLRDCLNALGEITGKVTSQAVLNNIFKHFCIGK